jgi:HPt (histidine-containing phosphotransfer) domain-containing protein
MNLRELGEKIGLEEAEYRELVELFLETGGADCSQLKTALTGGDAGVIVKKAHTICGAAGNLGIMDLHDAAKRIELAAKENRLERLSADMAEMEGQFKEISRSLGRYRD